MPQTRSKLIELEEQGLETNENYKEFLKEKNALKAEYPKEVFEDRSVSGPPNRVHFENYIQNYHELFREYMHRLTKIMLAPNSNYQKFLWDIIPDSTLEVMERRVRGRKTNIYR